MLTKQKGMDIFYGCLFFIGWNLLLKGAEALVVTLSPASPTVTQYSPLKFTCVTHSTDSNGSVVWNKLGQNNSLFSIGTIKISDCSPPFTSAAPNPTLYSYTCPATNRLTLTIRNVSRTENGDRWRCQFNINETRVNSNNGKITVQVGITGVTLSTATDPINVIENAQTFLKCRTSGGLPAAAVRWFIQRSGQVQDVTSLSTNTYQEEDNLNVTLSIFKFTPLRADQNGQIYCSAQNVEVEMNSEKPSFNVLYGPKTENLQNVSKVRGESLVYQCLYIPGNPPAVDFEWTRSATDVSWVDQNTQNLTIPNVQRSDEANYTCKVSSILRPTLTTATTTQYDTATFYLDILYGAENLVLQLNNVSHESVEVDEHSSNNLRCLLESDPGSEITLTKDGKTIIARSGVHQLTHEMQAECSDAGVYMCSGYNHYGAADNASVHLFVKCPARRPPGGEVQFNFAASQHENATLFYKTVAYPVPKPQEFVWKRCTNRSSCEPLSDEMNRFKIYTEGLSSKLTILDVQIEDYRLYQLSVSNGVGDTLVEWLRLSPIGKPDTPKDFHVIQDTIRETTAVFTWIPGFDNGSPQEFYVSYGKLVDNTEFITRTVKHDKEKEMNYTVENLEPGTEYLASLFAANNKGSSTSVNDTFLTLKRIISESPVGSPAAAIGGAVGGGIVAIIIVVGVVVSVKRFKQSGDLKTKDTLSETCRMNPLSKQQQKEDEELPDVVENSMYISAGDTVATESLYAKPNKIKTSKPIKSKINSEDEKAKKKGTSKSNPKKQYDNKGFEDQTYENHDIKETKKIVNKDGLIYADLEIAKPPKGQKKLSIHGEDDMTVYADVDLTKRAEPLLDIGEDIPTRKEIKT